MTGAVANQIICQGHGTSGLYAGNQPSLTTSFEQLPVSLGEDEFIPFSCEAQNEEVQPSENKPLWFTRFFRGIVNKAKKAWRTIRRFNPLTHLFSFIEKYRCRKHIENAQNRNGTQTNEEIIQYHESLLFNENNPSSSAIFRVHLCKDNKPRDLVVLFMGNGQDHASSEHNTGMIRLFNRLRQDGDVDVVLFRVGQADRELLHRFLLTSDCSLNTQVVLQHSVNVIEDIVNGRGMFEGHQSPRRVLFGGYSWGGGSIDQILRNHWQRIGQNIPVSATAYVDAIQLGSYNLGDAIEEKPPNSLYHCNFYQNNSYFVNGCHQGNSNHSEEIFESGGHNSLDDNPVVLNRIYSFFRRVIQS